jgi:hypothetical protein
MADDNPDFPGLIMPKGKPASETKPTIVPKSQGTGGAPPAPATGDPDFPGLTLPKGKSGASAAAPENSFLYDVFHPQPADLNRPQSWRDWATKTYSPTVAQGGRAALDDVSFGGADWARSKLTGENIADLRAQTADAQAALGPMGPVINAATYMAPGAPGRLISKGAGKLASTIGRYGAAAAEGGAASGLSSAVHQGGADTFDIDKVIKDTAKGVALGTAAQGIGDVTAPAVQRVGDYVTGKPGTAGEQWDWRTRAAAGDSTLPDDISLHQATLPPDHPAQPGLAKLQGALAQSTAPGSVADTATAGAGFGVNYIFGGGDNAAANWASTVGPAAISRLTVNPAAKAINVYDRNINVGQALDQLYGPLQNTKPSTTNVSGWADSLRDLTTGGQRPNEGNAQWW